MNAPLALTPGEPAGIGPDLAVMLAARTRRRPWVCVADPESLAARAAAIGIALTVRPWRPGQPGPRDAGVLPVWPHALASAVGCGRPDPANAGALLAALDRAVDGCRAGTFAALVTGPLHKATIADAGIPFSGHTEYLAARTGGTPVMMLLAGSLRVALATTHLPLRAVPDALTAARLCAVVGVLHDDLVARFAIARPRIAVLGLNPHAGESGHLGDEERDVIAPVIAELRGRGWALSGPLPADTAFTPAALAQCDAVLAMYHDQGLPVLKHAGFGRAVNCTLGLPIIRTSVDHGTALDLAGHGTADTGSLEAAIELAASLAASST